MQYIALLRGINVGGNNKIDMSKLRVFFESLKCTNVTTYLNSGNVVYESTKPLNTKMLSEEFKKQFGFEVPILVKTSSEMKSIVRAIPNNWQNDKEWKCDVAYLFNNVDAKLVVEELPVNKEFCDIRYTKGAIFWLVDRKNYNKSRISKIITSKYYQLMTIRNVNTARALGK